MALGFVQGQGAGQWEIREYATNSAATFLKGSAVAFNGARDVVEYTSVMSGLLGFALNDSVNSLPAGKVQVAIPRPGCTAWVDMAPGLVASKLSAGQAMGIGKRANYMSFYTDDCASVFSRVVESTGRYDSARSRIEVSFTQNNAEIYSTSSVSVG